MRRADTLDYFGRVCVVATMHGKERIIAPMLNAAFGLDVRAAANLDTDRFGTFSGEIPRAGSPLDAARAKIAAAFQLMPGASIGVASEGSFGPHPLIPFLPLGQELVLLVDRETGFELEGHHAGADTNFSHAVVTDLDAAMAFAERSGFPEHGLIVIGCNDGKPVPGKALIKDIIDLHAYQAAIQRITSDGGSAFVETDMRAHRNPTRMKNIERATADLIRRMQSACPACSAPGFDVTERVPGLPCAWCSAPTDVIRNTIWSCRACAFREDRPATDIAMADPGYCDICNP